MKWDENRTYGWFKLPPNRSFAIKEDISGSGLLMKVIPKKGGDLRIFKIEVKDGPDKYETTRHSYRINF